MIRELTELGRRKRQEQYDAGETAHDALTTVTVSVLIFLDESGHFIDIQELPVPQETICESIPAKKGKARIIIDKPEEVLEYTGNEIELALSKRKANETIEAARNRGILEAKKKHQWYKKKLDEYSHVKAVRPVVRFLSQPDEMKKARAAFEQKISTKAKKGRQIAFLVDRSTWLNRDQDLIDEIVNKYETKFQGGEAKCSVCGETGHPILDLPHIEIVNVPGGKKGRARLISFNWNAGESYGMEGNLNSQVCTSCARMYADGLNFLLRPSRFEKTSKGKDKPIYDNRHDLSKSRSNDTTVVFWTKEAFTLNLQFLDQPDDSSVREFLESLDKGTRASIDQNFFYSITLSGSSARIIIRDFIQISFTDLKHNVEQWFTDIDLDIYDGSGKKRFPPLWLMSEGLRRPNDPDHKDETPSRAQVYLWKAAMQGQQAVIPLWILARVLSRIRNDSFKLDEGKQNKPEANPDSSLSFGRVFSASRMALIKLILNRSSVREDEGGEEIMKSLNESSKDNAYLSGCVLALLAKIQYHAAKRDMNTSVVSKHYSSASVTPAATYGRLFKNAQNHLQKIRQDNPGLAVNLEKEVAGLCQKISENGGFPAIFTLEQQGRFALGFYQWRFKAVKGDEKERETTAEIVTEEDSD